MRYAAGGKRFVEFFESTVPTATPISAPERDALLSPCIHWDCCLSLTRYHSVEPSACSTASATFRCHLKLWWWWLQFVHLKGDFTVAAACSCRRRRMSLCLAEQHDAPNKQHPSPTDSRPPHERKLVLAGAGVVTINHTSQIVSHDNGERWRGRVVLRSGRLR